jgi:hypothetical protein
LDITGCIPQIIRLRENYVLDKFNFIKSFLNLNEKSTRELILKYPSILLKADEEKFKKIELYFNIYLTYTKEDLQKLVEKNPLLFIMNVK